MNEYRNRNLTCTITLASLGLATAFSSYLLLSGKQIISGATGAFAVFFLIGFVASTLGLGYCVFTSGRFRVERNLLSFKGVFSTTIDLTSSHIKKRQYSMVVAAKGRRILIPKKDSLLPLFESVYETTYNRKRSSPQLKLPFLIVKSRRPVSIILLLGCLLSLGMSLLLILGYRSMPLSYSLAITGAIVLFIAITLLAAGNMLSAVLLEGERITLKYYAKRRKQVSRDQIRSTKISVNYTTYDLWLELHLRSARAPHTIVLTDADRIGDLTLYELQDLLTPSGT
jgi:hypothetical protein